MIHPSVNCLHPITVNVTQENGTIHGLVVPCGHCIACKMKKTREWTLRLIMEAQDYDPDAVQFVTLTYAPEYLPSSRSEFRRRHMNDDDYDPNDSFEDIPDVPTICKRDVQLFLKRLRKRMDHKIRFYATGEYGERFGRPHYHLLLFGVYASDAKKVLDAWNMGIVSVDNFYKETCGYVAGYVQKKLYGNLSYGSALPPFLLCSQHLGENFFWRNVDNICHEGFISWQGYKYGIPRTFRRKAILEGYLPETDMEELVAVQNTELHNLMSHLTTQGSTIEEYEKEFIKLKTERFKKANIKRDFNVDF